MGGAPWRSRQADSWPSTARGPAARAFPSREAARYLLRVLRLPSRPAASRPFVTKVKPGPAIINTTPRYDSEAAAGTDIVINADELVLTNNHLIDDSTKITGTVTSTGKASRSAVLPMPLPPQHRQFLSFSVLLAIARYYWRSPT